MSTIPPPRVPLVDREGRMSPEWYRWFTQFERAFNASGPTEGAGIDVAAGVVSIQAGGVTNAMLRDSLGCSVIGRYQDSTGDPADIVAGANGRVLMRVDDILVFREITPGSGTVGDGDYGDISVAAGVWSIDANTVTLAKMADIATDRLIGRDTAGTGDPETLTVGGGIEFTGAGGIQTSAFTGDATKAAGGTALTLATVNANVGTFGSAGKAVTFTVNGKGLITAASEANISITASQVSDFSTAADARIAAAVGVSVQAFDADLSALAANSTDGFWAHTGAGTGAARTLTAPAAGLTISNPAGVAGNPTFALANDLAALEALSGTNTIYYRSGADTWSAVTIGGNLGFSAGTLGSSLGTAATKNTGTSGDAVPVLNGAATTWSATLTASGAANSNIGFRATDGTRTLRMIASSGATGQMVIGSESNHTVVFEVNTTEVARLTASGWDVTGEARCDSLRIDQTPTAETPTPTHTFTISLNGTTYRIPCLV